MAFTVTTTRKGVQGDVRYLIGAFTNTGGTTGGTISTGFNRIEHAEFQYTGTAAAWATPIVVTQTIPVSGGDIKIVTEANGKGTFKIEGY